MYNFDEFDFPTYQEPKQIPMYEERRKEVCIPTSQKITSYEKLRKKNKKLKKNVKEYKVLNTMIQKENDQYKTKSSAMQKQLTLLKDKNRETYNTTHMWYKRHQF